MLMMYLALPFFASGLLAKANIAANVHLSTGSRSTGSRFLSDLRGLQHQTCHEPVWNRRQAILLASVCTAFPTISHAAQPQFVRQSQAAFDAFQQGDYVGAEKLWGEVANRFPKESLAWANYGTCLIINASDEMTLGELPTGQAEARLKAALDALDKAEDLGSSDALLLNSRGNALGLLQRWEEAREQYVAACAVSARDFESIPRSNAALISFQLGDMQRVEREALSLVRRDPRFVDGQALLAAARWSAGDVRGAASAFEKLCSDPKFCARYASDQVVLGRWTPRAVDAYRGLLKEPSVQLAVKNARAMS